MNSNLEWAAERELIGRRVREVAALLRVAPEAHQRVLGLDWTVAELAAHLVTEPARFTTMAGTADLERPVSMAELNARMIADLGPHDLDGYAGMLEQETELFFEALGADGDAPFRWFDVDTTVGQAGGVLLGELLVHGLDLARTLGRPWPIERAEALAVIHGLVPLLPLFVDPEAAAALSATFEVRLRGGEPITIELRDGRPEVRPGAAPAADLRVSADPVAYLLVGYGRISQWSAILRGKIVAWGRRPWLALRFGRLFQRP